MNRIEMLRIFSVFNKMVSDTLEITNDFTIEIGNRVPEKLELLMRDIVKIAGGNKINISDEVYLSKFYRYEEFKDLCSNIGLVTNSKRCYAVVNTLPLSNDVLDVYSINEDGDRIYSVRSHKDFETYEGFRLHKNISRISRGPLKIGNVSIYNKDEVYIYLYISEESTLVRYGLIGMFNITVNLSKIK